MDDLKLYGKNSSLQLDQTINKEMKDNFGNEYIRRVKLICKKSKFWEYHPWPERLGYRCGEVQRSNYILKRDEIKKTLHKGKLEGQFV